MLKNQSHVAREVESISISSAPKVPSLLALHPRLYTDLDLPVAFVLLVAGLLLLFLAL